MNPNFQRLLTNSDHYEKKKKKKKKNYIVKSSGKVLVLRFCSRILISKTVMRKIY